MSWTVEFLNPVVREELEVLPSDIEASFLRIARLIRLMASSVCTSLT